MTMQTTTLPFQVSGANALAQPQRNAAAGVQAPDADAFSASLSRAMAPTMAPSPAPSAAPAPGPANKQATPAKQADKPAAQGPKTAAREPARQNEAADAPATAQQAAPGAEAADPAKDAAAAAESASAAAEAATTPVTDMLAFMASLAQPAPAAPVVAAPSAAQVPAAAVAAGGAELQLAALQSAFAKLETTDGAAVATDPALATATDGEAAASGFSLAAGVQPAAHDSADLRALQQSAQAAVQQEPGKVQPQARDAAAVQANPAVEAPAPSVTQLQAQAAKLETVPNPAAVPTDRIPARVGTQAWDNQVSQRIVYMVGKEQAATLTLNPPDLGPVQVVLNVSNDGASVAFSSNQQEVRQALENALPRLREMMGENGIALGNATVDAGMPDQRQAQQDGERRNQGGSGGFGNAGGTGAANEDSAARPATRTVALGDNGLVDTFA
ncbi:flagellar hook-length control protein FliK [Massilia sp. 9I]|uniref:flagellar hook-length control protein FliK n=1 Tax=Massilia sp. 9I TaxID=2653152 RepID=UPI0012F303AA|nr:flagellar hook-length control protein FliK [Massilia sp. 9I]VXC66891.1 Flagellar hook-length control protein fliK [Massilia sp. 9I]